MTRTSNVRFLFFGLLAILGTNTELAGDDPRSNDPYCIPNGTMPVDTTIFAETTRVVSYPIIFAFEQPSRMGERVTGLQALTF